MDRLIHDLYKKKIIQIKKTKLKNGVIVPFNINFLDIFNYPVILEQFICELNNFILNNKLNCKYIYGKNDLCKNLCTLLSYKYDYNNIIRENLHSYKENEVKNECLLIKENLGSSNKTLKLIKTLDSFNIETCSFLSLINYNISNTSNNTYYFLDCYKIVSVLYKKEEVDYDRFLNIYAYLTNNSYLNLEDRLKISNKNYKINIKPIIEKIIEKKSLLLFCCSVIQKLGFKDLVRTLDFVGKHVCVVKMDNLEQYNEVEIKALIKLAMHHNFKIMSEHIYDKLNFIQIISIYHLLNPDLKLDNRLYIINDNIPNYYEFKNDLLQQIKKMENVIGIITDNNLFLQENKLKIFNIQNLEDNILENKLIKETYDLLIVNSTETLVSLKHLSWNIYEKYNRD